MMVGEVLFSFIFILGMVLLWVGMTRPSGPALLGGIVCLIIAF